MIAERAADIIRFGGHHFDDKVAAASTIEEVSQSYPTGQNQGLSSNEVEVDWSRMRTTESPLEIYQSADSETAATSLPNNQDQTVSPSYLPLFYAHYKRNNWTQSNSNITQ